MFPASWVPSNADRRLHAGLVGCIAAGDGRDGRQEDPLKDRILPHLWTWEDDDARRVERAIDAQMDAPRSGTRVLSFAGEHGSLSNLHSSPVRIAGSTWPTVEHVYQGAKARGIDCMKKALCAPSPANAKRIGGRLTMREGFDEIEDAVMLRAGHGAERRGSGVQGHAG